MKFLHISFTIQKGLRAISKKKKTKKLGINLRVTNFNWSKTDLVMAIRSR